ncbi:MAG: SH3 domain-containing protein [Gammaproteobacteria bacterium]|nr:SH3 domain-containing protein [Gammaproteobacteria bacterium]
MQVYDPYIELHTGPGRGYPVFYVVSRDEWVEIIVRQTDWFKVRSETGIEGWVARNEMLQTLSPDGKRIELKEASQEDFVDRRWEMGMLGGDFQGAYVITTYGGYHLTENISTEVSLSQVLGNLSSSVMLGFHLVEEPFPEWTVSPFFSLGTGLIETKAKSTLAVVKDRRNNFSHYSIGARMYLTKRFLVRIDYGNYVIFTTKDNNEEIREWKAGFAFFF